MNAEDLERVYEAVARKVDEVGEAHSELFLAKLVLLLAQGYEDVSGVQTRIDDAALSLAG